MTLVCPQFWGIFWPLPFRVDVISVRFLSVFCLCQILAVKMHQLHSPVTSKAGFQESLWSHFKGQLIAFVDPTSRFGCFSAAITFRILVKWWESLILPSKIPFHDSLSLVTEAIAPQIDLGEEAPGLLKAFLRCGCGEESPHDHWFSGPLLSLNSLP